MAGASGKSARGALRERHNLVLMDNSVTIGASQHGDPSQRGAGATAGRGSAQPRRHQAAGRSRRAGHPTSRDQERSPALRLALPCVGTSMDIAGLGRPEFG